MASDAAVQGPPVCPACADRVFGNEASATVEDQLYHAECAPKVVEKVAETYIRAFLSPAEKAWITRRANAAKAKAAAKAAAEKGD